MNQATVTISAATAANARAEIQRLNGELAELHKDEQRCQLVRTRLEAERTRVLAFIDICDLVQRLADKPDTAPVATLTPIFPERASGPYIVRAPNGIPKHPKPPGLPSVAKMIMGALVDAASHGQSGLRPRDMAHFARQNWRCDVQTKVVNTVAWKMMRDGRLAKHDGLYSLNGHGLNAQ